MANDKSNGPVFVNLRAGLKHPKLSWFIMMLNKYGIRHRVIRTLTGSMLQVEQGTIEIASGILTQELTRFNAVAFGNEDADPMELVITIDDLPDDHVFFEEQVATDTLRKPVPAPIEAELPSIKELRDVLALDDEDPFAPDLVEDEGDTAEDEDEDEDWGFEDIADDPEPATEVSNVIDIKARVSDAVTDPDFETAKPAEPVEAKPRKPRDKEVKQVTDPDFETAKPAEAEALPITGTEFLKADEELPWEDVDFPGVTKAIRMYDVDSSNISAIGFKPPKKQGQLTATFYIRFKAGDSVYRNNPVPVADINEILNLAVRRKRGIQEASVGSFYYHTIKEKAEAGTIACQRLKGDAWVEVLPKAERTKQMKQRDKN